jgi:hypothetical protein
MRFKQTLIVVCAIATVVSGSALAQTTAFVACPVFRNVHEMRGCWLTLYKDDWYYLGSPGGVGDSGSLPPQLKHQALIEGVVSDAPRICGGLVLRSLSVSPLPEIDRRCDTVLPAQGYSIPSQNARHGIATIEELTPPPQPPFSSRTVNVNFYFGNNFLGVPSQFKVQGAAIYILAADAKHIAVTGQAAATRLSDGSVLTEPAGLAEQRAKKIATMLRGLGVPDDRLQVNWQRDVFQGDALSAPAHRTVEIAITIE